VQVGYPRFDHYFWGEIEINRISQELDLDPAKETILWLPTWSKLSTIDEFVDKIASLKDRYNLVVKLHPLTSTQEPERVKIVEEAGIKLAPGINRDNVELFAVADYVICDYGGSAFGAIYLDKKLLLLNVKEPESDTLTGSESLDIQIRKHFPNVNPGDKSNLLDLLRNEGLWEKQASKRREIKEYVFSPYQGTASETAAKTISNAAAIIGRNSGRSVTRWRAIQPLSSIIANKAKNQLNNWFRKS
jgi:CDP-glycerol glycerophosphotransferase (TagB/SpsB family)